MAMKIKKIHVLCRAKSEKGFSPRTQRRVKYEILSTFVGVRYLEREHKPCFLPTVGIGNMAEESTKSICEVDT